MGSFSAPKNDKTGAKWLIWYWLIFFGNISRFFLKKIKNQGKSKPGKVLPFIYR